MDARTAETLRAANMALTQSLSLEVVLERLLDCLSRLVPYDSAKVMLLEEGWRLVVRAARGYADPEKVEGSVWSVASHGIFRRLVGERRSVLVADTEADRKWIVHAGTEDVRCWMGVPLLAGRELSAAWPSSSALTARCARASSAPAPSSRAPATPSWASTPRASSRAGTGRPS